MKMKPWLLFFFLSLNFLTTVVIAGNPLVIDEAHNNGRPSRWPYDAVQKKYVVHWRADPGRLNGSVSNDAAINKVKQLFSIWQSMTINSAAEGNANFVHTVALDIHYDGKVAADITKDNYPQYTNPASNNMSPAVVIFDEDGSIIDAYLQTDGASKTVVGLGTPLSDGSSIRSGFIILNGRFLNGDPNDGETTPTVFNALILHELGHLLNLDHSQLNWDIADECQDNEGCPEGNAIPTMYPFLSNEGQFVLQRDDKVALSWLYPSQDFKNKFCVIEGEIQDKDGKGEQGVNVVARSLANDLVDSRSFVSGSLYKKNTHSGEYILAGLIPGVDYEVSFEALSKDLNDPAHKARWVGPLGPESPTGFSPGIIVGDNGSHTVRCEHGGEVIQMPAMKVYKGMPGSEDTSEDDSTTDDSTKKKGWFCALDPQGSQGWETIGSWGLLLFVLGSIRLIHYSHSRAGGNPDSGSPFSRG